MADIDGTPDGRGSGEPGAARTALDSLADSVVAVEEGRVSYANAAAIESFDLPSDPAGRPAAALPWWEALAPAIREATIGTAREVSGEGLPAPARIHRRDGGATITFDGTGGPSVRDRAVKDRAMDEAPVGITIADADGDLPLVYANEAFERVTGYPIEEVVGRNCRFLQGEGSDPEAVAEMGRAIEEARPVTVELENYRRDGTEFWNEVTIAPVREDGELTHFVGFQDDVTDRKRAELALERRTAELEHVLSRIEGLVRDVLGAVAGARDRTALEEAVCERIADEEGYGGVWIGERDAGRGTIEVRAKCGADPAALDLDSDHPAAAAIERGEVTVGDEGAAFPLSHSGVEYGVMVVAGAIDDREQTILSALSRAVASGINARETSRILETDAVVAVELRIGDRGFAPAALSAEADCHLEYRRSTHLAEEPAALFTVSGATPGDLEAAVAERPGVSVRTVVEREAGGGGEPELLVELRTEEPGLVEWLSTRGGVVRSISAEEGVATVRLELPAEADVRTVVEAIEERHPGTDTRSIRRRERAGETRTEFASRLEADLTDRQLAALRRAYLGGYFEWPRPTTGEDLAESMGVARPTFHEHLRTAERKLCTALFEAYEPEDTT